DLLWSERAAFTRHPGLRNISEISPRLRRAGCVTPRVAPRRASCHRSPEWLRADATQSGSRTPLSNEAFDRSTTLVGGDQGERVHDVLELQRGQLIQLCD